MTAPPGARLPAASACLKSLYPLLFFILTWRTISVRVLPSDALLNFRTLPPDESGAWGRLLRLEMSILQDMSLFSWADKGEWATGETQDEVLRREWEWFRIGFEPMFADYRKEGAWLVIVLLLEVRVAAGFGAPSELYGVPSGIVLDFA